MQCTSCGKREAELSFRHFQPCRKCFIHVLESRMKKEFRELGNDERLLLSMRTPLLRFVLSRLVKNPSVRTVRKNPTKIVLGISLDGEIASYFAGIERRESNVIAPFRGITLEELEAYAGLNRIKMRKEPLKGLAKDFLDFFNSLESRRPGTKFSVLKSIGKLDEILGRR